MENGGRTELKSPVDRYVYKPYSLAIMLIFPQTLNLSMTPRRNQDAKRSSGTNVANHVRCHFLTGQPIISALNAQYHCTLLPGRISGNPVTERFSSSRIS